MITYKYMKTKNKYKPTFAYCLTLVFILMPYVSAYGYYPYDQNYYGAQYSISPLMTSTTPYGYQNYNNGYYAGYSSNYYDNNPSNNYQYQQPYYNNNYSYSPGYYLAGANSSYYNNGYNPLSVSCYANNSYVTQNQPIRWTVNVSGGLTGYYSYSWKGTDNPLSLNLSSIAVSYQLPGVKTMSVTVIDPGGRTNTAYCGSATVGQNYYYPVPLNGYVY